MQQKTAHGIEALAVWFFAEWSFSQLSLSIELFRVENAHHPCDQE